MPKYNVTGRVRADINFDETVEADSEEIAVEKVESKIYEKCGFTSFDVIDNEIYCEEV
ncbi:MAG TPA: hypothetical protein VN704_04810 [Verrucomicrobiae bacterium]|nr:hypothetical protein [Verrucomicrobiae bacterium]